LVADTRPLEVVFCDWKWKPPAVVAAEGNEIDYFNPTEPPIIPRPSCWMLAVRVTKGYIYLVLYYA
jgi:hypothetical protein